ncbi:MAG: carbamoyltransferase, partial [Sporomusaceae bacterium]|nr:carbamoyltransferase [Sporomusaceae bacterium]
MREAILGISAFYHDSAAVLLLDGEITAAAQEERFTRKKQDASFPINAAKYVMDEAGLIPADLTAVAFYDKPWLKFERLLETYHAFAPNGLKSFLAAMPVWIKEKVFMRQMLQDNIALLGLGKPTVLFPEHHLSHAASAFYPSPFEEAAVLTVDGVGEWATTAISHGKGKELKILRELNFPHSLGLFYSAFTYYTGFKVNSGEYKMMGLAPYGDPEDKQTITWANLIKEELVDIRGDGSILLNMDYFNYAVGLTMCRDSKWEKLFGIPKRKAESKLTLPYMNLALAGQLVTEEIMLRLVKTAKKLTNCKNLVLSGGVALNCTASGKILHSGIFDDIWIQPAAGDAGGALGAALAAWHIGLKRDRSDKYGKDLMQGSYLGPEYSEIDILKTTRKYSAPFEKYDNFAELCDIVAARLEQGAVVGWFQGRMEWGPRALGNRSILGDVRDAGTQKKLNLKIKYREGFRPFAPSVLSEDAEEYFDLRGHDSPYMLLVTQVQEKRCRQLPEGYKSKELYERLYYPRSDIPSVTHIDFSARIQTVHKETNPRYHQLISSFKAKTGYGVLVNTSFNVRGEPIVCTPEDAYLCFMRTEMDYLVLGDFIFTKTSQP